MCNKIMMEDDIGIFSVPYDEIDTFKELLVDFYETNNSEKMKDFFRKKCLLLNPEYKQKEKTISEMIPTNKIHYHR